MSPLPWSCHSTIHQSLPPSLHPQRAFSKLFLQTLTHISSGLLFVIVPFSWIVFKHGRFFYTTRWVSRSLCIPLLDTALHHHLWLHRFLHQVEATSRISILTHNLLPPHPNYTVLKQRIFGEHGARFLYFVHGLRILDNEWFLVG